MALPPLVAYDAATSARWMALNDETSLDSALHVAACWTLTALSLWAAQEQGLFAKHGIDPQLILIRGGATLVASLVTGEIHRACTSGVSKLGAAA